MNYLSQKIPLPQKIGEPIFFFRKFIGNKNK